jgi:hypothetical protein
LAENLIGLGGPLIKEPDCLFRDKKLFFPVSNIVQMPELLLVDADNPHQLPLPPLFQSGFPQLVPLKPEPQPVDHRRLQILARHNRDPILRRNLIPVQN